VTPTSSRSLDPELPRQPLQSLGGTTRANQRLNWGRAARRDEAKSTDLIPATIDERPKLKVMA
jgi:hypothetical protein